MMKYIRFTFKNVEPLKIADDSMSQSGQVNALSYVPGTALRGALIDSFVRAGEFDAFKDVLLSDEIAFLNAYIMLDGRELIPSPKGFYEDKTESGDQAKVIENMLKNGEITPGNKRAALGKYCCFDGDCIRYSHVEMGSDMKINKGGRDRERTVFRNQYIKPGYTFSAYISFTDAAQEGSVHTKVQEVLTRMRENDALILGGSRSFGYGKCSIGEIEMAENIPYEGYFSYAADPTQKELCDIAYMMLLSDTAMISRNGAPVGLDADILREKLGLDHLEITLCSTSVVNRQGYNRTWQTWLPSAKMYEMGSVFKLSFPGEKISAETALKIMQEGIGVRINEGFGRAAFFSGDDYEKLEKKKEIKMKSALQTVSDGKLNPDELQTLQIAARGYYLKLTDRAVDAVLAGSKSLPGRFHLNSTQLGTIESIILSNLYSKDTAFKKLDEYFKNALDNDSRQRAFDGSAGREGIAKYLSNVRGQKLSELFPGLPDEVMGLKVEEILSLQDIDRIKLEFIVKQIKFENRGKEA